MLQRFGQVALLYALLLVEVALIPVASAMIMLSFAMGMVFFFPWQARMIRWVTQRHRRLLREWTDIEIEAPYLPAPPPPVPMADGLYRADRTLYKSPRMPAWNDRFKWLLTDPATWRDGLWLLLDPVVKVGLLPLFAVFPARGLRLYALMVRVLLGATSASRLAVQVTHLRQVRNLAADSQAAEMRRIERDLHDGTQARLVAIGMTLGAVEQLIDDNPAAAKALLAKTRDASAETLTELRTVIRGIHPPVLAERGLADAVRALAVDSPLRVSVDVELPDRLEPPVEAAAYFVISELLANAARHSEAESVVIDISTSGGALRVTVRDDGMGGADPAKGSGLTGIERRLAAFDGVLALNSPPGGPTVVTLDIPHVLPDQGDSAKLPAKKAATLGVLYATAWCPLFPQGLIAAIFKIFHIDERSWFVALYLPEPLQWPMIVFNVTLGIMMYIVAMRIRVVHKRTVGLGRAGGPRAC
ncbi:sensor histidine kinase [Nonomuraea spiralis]|uniref:sensor histidine kinase n=1 Tax=Nonomuraea TaxID=83681 RepID=UPI000F790C0F|nr:histidine kinase [Nonomuraea sp. WAC 01424]RSN03536.1 sensor histidine kinase [Nonomuraea sp. WAC 01424]